MNQQLSEKEIDILIEALKLWSSRNYTERGTLNMIGAKLYDMKCAKAGPTTDPQTSER